MKTVRVKLKDCMQKRGISQAKLTRETKLSPNTVKGYYHGDVIRAELRVVAILCEYLQCDISELMVLEEKSSDA